MERNERAQKYLLYFGAAIFDALKKSARKDKTTNCKTRTFIITLISATLLQNESLFHRCLRFQNYILPTTPTIYSGIIIISPITLSYFSGSNPPMPLVG